MDISSEAIDELEEILKEKTKLNGKVRLSFLESENEIVVQFIQKRDAPSVLKEALKKAGVETEVNKYNGDEGRSHDDNFEKAVLKPDEFKKFLKSIGADKEYQKILEKPIASKIVVERMEDEPVDSVTLYYPTEIAAKAAFAKLQKDIAEAKGPKGKPSAYTGKSEETDNYYITFPVSPERSSKDYVKIIAQVSGKKIDDLGELPEKLIKTLGEQSYDDTSTARAITNPRETLVSHRKLLMKKITEGINEYENAINAISDTNLDKKAKDKLAAFKTAMATVKKSTEIDAPYVEAVKQMNKAGLELKDALPRLYEEIIDKDKAMKTLVIKVGNDFTDLGYAYSEGMGNAILFFTKNVSQEFENDVFEEKREKDAERVVKEIDGGKYGAEMQKALEKVRSLYTKTVDNKTFIDTDRDGRPDTAVQILRRATQFGNNHQFDHLIMDKATAIATSTVIIEEIKNGKRGNEQLKAYNDIAAKNAKKDIRTDKNIITFDGLIPATSLEILEKIGEAAGVDEYKNMRKTIGRDINALDDIAEWRKNKEAQAPKTPAQPMSLEEKKR